MRSNASSALPAIIGAVAGAAFAVAVTIIVIVLIRRNRRSKLQSQAIDTEIDPSRLLLKDLLTSAPSGRVYRGELKVCSFIGRFDIVTAVNRMEQERCL